MPLIRNKSNTREDILPDKWHKGSSIPVLSCNNKARVVYPLDLSKTLLVSKKPPFIIFSADPNRLINLDNFTRSTQFNRMRVKVRDAYIPERFEIRKDSGRAYCTAILPAHVQCNLVVYWHAYLGPTVR